MPYNGLSYDSTECMDAQAKADDKSSIVLAVCSAGLAVNEE